METSAAVEALSALAHEPRLAVFRLLVQAGPQGLAAGVIARAMSAPPNSLSNNLGILLRAGLVRSSRAGRSVIYRANYDGMLELLVYLLRDCCRNDAEVCRPLFDVLRRAACCNTAGSAPA